MCRGRGVRVGARRNILSNCRRTRHLFGASRKGSQELSCPGSHFWVGNPRAKGSSPPRPIRVWPQASRLCRGKTPFDLEGHPAASGPCSAQVRMGGPRRGLMTPPVRFCTPPFPVTWTRLPQPEVLIGTNHEEERGRHPGQWVSAPRGRWAGPTACPPCDL